MIKFHYINVLIEIIVSKVFHFQKILISKTIQKQK